jgi:hypothetical protein
MDDATSCFSHFDFDYQPGRSASGRCSISRRRRWWDWSVHTTAVLAALWRTASQFLFAVSAAGLFQLRLNDQSRTATFHAAVQRRGDYYSQYDHADGAFPAAQLFGHGRDSLAQVVNPT